MGVFSYSLTQNDLRVGQRELANVAIRESNRKTMEKGRGSGKGKMMYGCGGGQHTGRKWEQQLAQISNS